MLDTSNPNNYKYETKYLEIYILGGLKTNKLESLRIGDENRGQLSRIGEPGGGPGHIRHHQ